MKLAVSNIAWPADADSQAAQLLGERNVTGVELAPTKVWPRPLEASAADLRGYRQQWERRGMRIVALQALLFERPHFRVFGSEQQRQECFDYLAGILRVASQLGAGALVFGSPKNRVVGDLSPTAVREIAMNFFRGLGEHALRHGVTLCIEPNPAEYGCDFVTTVAEGIELVRAVDHPGFALHLDTGGMHLSGEPSSCLASVLPRCKHFHISEPFLAPVGAGCVSHAEFGSSLADAAYEHWLSIEMRCPGDDWAETVDRAIAHARLMYSPCSKKCSTAAA